MALKTAIQGKGRGKPARPTSTPKQRPKPQNKPVVQEIDEDEADDEPLSQRKAALQFGQGVAAYDKATQEEELPPGLGLNPQGVGATSLETQPDSPIDQGIGQETQPDPSQQNLHELDPQPDYYTLGEHGLPAPETIQAGPHV